MHHLPRLPVQEEFPHPKHLVQVAILTNPVPGLAGLLRLKRKA